VTSESVTARLAASGLTLPAVPEAVGSYIPAVRAGNLVFTSGQIPLADGAPLATGCLGQEVSIEEGQRCAELCALRALAAAATVVDLDRVVRVVKVVGYVASAPGFAAQPAVIDRASSVMDTAFGKAGCHAREAVGVASLPLGVPVEVSVVFEVA
jgi:enamine deaminase RidA (YjgF/YER057c/UK114 family)